MINSDENKKTTEESKEIEYAELAIEQMWDSGYVGNFNFEAMAQIVRDIYAPIVDERDQLLKHYAIFEEVSPPDVPRSTFVKWCFEAWSNKDKDKFDRDSLRSELDCRRGYDATQQNEIAAMRHKLDKEVNNAMHLSCVIEDLRLDIEDLRLDLKDEKKIAEGYHDVAKKNWSRVKNLEQQLADALGQLHCSACGSRWLVQDGDKMRCSECDKHWLSTESTITDTSKLVESCKQIDKPKCNHISEPMTLDEWLAVDKSIADWLEHDEIIDWYEQVKETFRNIIERRIKPSCNYISDPLSTDEENTVADSARDWLNTKHPDSWSKNYGLFMDCVRAVVARRIKPDINHTEPLLRDEWYKECQIQCIIHPEDTTYFAAKECCGRRFESECQHLTISNDLTDEDMDRLITVAAHAGGSSEWPKAFWAAVVRSIAKEFKSIKN